jgi:hypothetical protein
MSENTNTSEIELVVGGSVESIHNDIPVEFLYTLGKSLIDDHKEMILENDSIIIHGEEPVVEVPHVIVEELVVEEPPVIVEELVVEEPPVVVEEPVVEEPPVVVEEPVVEEPLFEESTPTVEINVKCGCFSIGTSFLYKR